MVTGKLAIENCNFLA